MHTISLVVAYRDRDLNRVERFLASIHRQTFTDFELIFVDYGSQDHYATGAKGLCSKYQWCTYFYSSTAGMYWNRSHALNTGIRQANGQYVICTDIDMMYSENLLAAVVERMDTSIQLYSQIYLLPESFTSHDSLINKPTTFELTTENGLGGMQCVAKEVLFNIHGFDEYYKIWGIEDHDLAERLEKSGLSLKWLPPDYAPIYHQWHPAVSVRSRGFPQWWYDDMSLHFTLKKSDPIRNPSEWGELISTSSRKLLTQNDIQVLTVQKFLGPFEKKKLAVKIAEIMEKDGAIEIIVEPRSKTANTATQISNIVNRVLSKLQLPIEIQKRNGLTKSSSTEFMHFVVLSYLKENALSDYFVTYNEDDTTSFKLCIL